MDIKASEVYSTAKKAFEKYVYFISHCGTSFHFCYLFKAVGITPILITYLYVSLKVLQLYKIQNFLPYLQPMQL